MSVALGNSLVDLACDGDRLARFMANPQSELAGTSLTPAEIEAILTRDSRKVSWSPHAGSKKPRRKFRFRCRS